MNEHRTSLHNEVYGHNGIQDITASVSINFKTQQKEILGPVVQIMTDFVWNLREFLRSGPLL